MAAAALALAALPAAPAPSTGCIAPLELVPVLKEVSSRPAGRAADVALCS